MKKLALAAALLLALGLSEVPAYAARPIPHTPCAALNAGKDPASHLRYWASKGWYLSATGWHQHGGAGCWGDP